MTGRAARNMFDRAPVRITREGPNRVMVEFEDLRFVKGYAPGDDNNCLIQALLQSINDVGIPCIANARWVRKEMIRRFGSGADEVTELNFLDLRPHSASIIDLIGMSARDNGLDPTDLIHAENFSVTCVAEEQLVVGEVVGTGRIPLYVLNESLLHFVPLLKDRARRERP